MSQHYRIGRIDESQPSWASPTEPESHIEHQAALDATLFHSSRDFRELVFELDAGELRIRGPRKS